MCEIFRIDETILLKALQVQKPFHKERRKDNKVIPLKRYLFKI